MNKCYSQDAFSPIKFIDTENPRIPPNQLVIDLDRTNGGNSKVIELSANETFYNLSSAIDRFVQCNIRASREDFKTLIKEAPENDFIYISLANKMADLGFFDLADFAVSKMRDKDLTNISTDAMKRFYYPRRKIKLENELFLAEIYSNIIYNNQSTEATNELLKEESLLLDSDYANYLAALGYYKSGSYSKAAKYINVAILQNPTTLNYQKLKAQILAEMDQPQEAVKVVENLKKQNLYAYEYERKIKSLEQFILYKVGKTEWEKNYHLGYYHYLENDSSKAIRTLQTALSCKGKHDKGAIYALMSEIYLGINEFEKAADTAQKAYKIRRNNPKALLTLGDLSYRDKNYKKALAYYKTAACYDRKSYKPLIKEALTYQKLNNVKKSKEIYIKVLKTHSDSWEAYYNVALLDNEKRIIYLKKALAVNPQFEDAWIELAKIDIDKGNYAVAQKYLANAFYIDENDFRYYYYQGLINNNTGDVAQAKYNFKKCLKLNANFKEAQKALDSILNSDTANLQDNI
ncbi:MAG: tetratricopeptide repeat protein [Candidatus Gastranaerophilales bacterium]|nr:tetratricopeptide repeat protein [Candidatus Gastranaerophilales bacterium]